MKLEDSYRYSHDIFNLISRTSVSGSGRSSNMWGIKLLLVLAVMVGASQAVTIMSIDFGSEWIKVAVVAVSFRCIRVL